MSENDVQNVNPNISNDRIRKGAGITGIVFSSINLFLIIGALICLAIIGTTTDLGVALTTIVYLIWLVVFLHPIGAVAQVILSFVGFMCGLKQYKRAKQGFSKFAFIYTLCVFIISIAYAVVGGLGLLW